jgi:hypothetical protein
VDTSTDKYVDTFWVRAEFCSGHNGMLMWPHVQLLVGGLSCERYIHIVVLERL